MHTGQPAKSLDDMPLLFKRSNQWKVVPPAKLEIFGATSRGDVDNACSLRLSNVVPQDHLVNLCSSGRDGFDQFLEVCHTAGSVGSRQIVERTAVGPALHLGTFEF